MATMTWSAATAESSNVAGTALNSIANGAETAVIADIDNTSTKYPYLNLWLVLGSLTPTSGGSVTIRLKRKRSSTYSDSTATMFGGEFQTRQLTTSASAKYVAFTHMQIGPFIYGITLVNNSGVTTASSGNELYYQQYSEVIA